MFYISYAHLKSSGKLYSTLFQSKHTKDTINACSTRLLDCCQAGLMGWDPGDSRRPCHGPVPMVSEPLFAKQPWFLWQALEKKCTVLNSWLVNEQNASLMCFPCTSTNINLWMLQQLISPSGL